MEIKFSIYLNRRVFVMEHLLTYLHLSIQTDRSEQMVETNIRCHSM